MYISTPNLAILVYSDPKYWVTTRVTNMAYLFQKAASFNKDISEWNVSKVTKTTLMFFLAKSFNQDLCVWRSYIQDAEKWMMFRETDCPTADISYGDASDIRVCHSCVPPLVNNGWSPSGSLGICEGDCDRDQDCDGGLMCFHRNGITHVPGCINGGSADINGMDYCVENVALQGTASQSCDWDSTAVAQKAIDGSTNGWGHYKVAHTCRQDKP